MSEIQADTKPLTPTATAPPPLTRQPSTVANDPQKFVHGVIIRGKFIGVEDVKQETGDEICQNSMIKLKALVLAKKEHKQRICLKISLEGIEILDEKTNVSMYKHAVNRISYIARDINDARAIGYIYKNSNNEFQYFAIKTERQAQELFNLLKELFEVVLEMRNSKKAETIANDVPTSVSANNETNAQVILKEEKIVDSQPESSLLDIKSEESILANHHAAPAQEINTTAAGLLDLMDEPSSSSAPVVSAPKPSQSESDVALLDVFSSSAPPPQPNKIDLNSLYSQSTLPIGGFPGQPPRPQISLGYNQAPNFGQVGAPQIGMYNQPRPMVAPYGSPQVQPPVASPQVLPTSSNPFGMPATNSIVQNPNNLVQAQNPFANLGPVFNSTPNPAAPPQANNQFLW